MQPHIFNFYRRIEKGFTLIELMVTISIFSILMALAAPSLQDLFIKNNIKKISDDFIQGIFKAKNTAVSKNMCTVMCMSVNTSAAKPTCSNSGGDWQPGWIVFMNPSCDLAKNSPDAVTDILEIRQGFTDGYFLQSQSSTPKRKIMFNARGYTSLSSADEFDIIYKSPNHEANERLSMNICLDALGRARTVPSSKTCKTYN